MSDEQPGLRPRLAHASRRLPAQHEYLDALLATTRRALERNTPPEAREALHAFRGALDAHFALEEQVHFPALHGLEPGCVAQIEELVLDHHALRDRLLVLEGQVGRDRATPWRAPSSTTGPRCASTSRARSVSSERS
jgi:iron-sulfur cluster repair protein YtfE (RIC family)